MTDDTRLQDIQRVLERIGYYADADTLRDVGQELAALRAQVQQQALDLITARSEAEEAHADAQRLQVLRDNLEHDGYGWWIPSACVREQYNPNDGTPSLDDVRATIDAIKESHDRP